MKLTTNAVGLSLVALAVGCTPKEATATDAGAMATASATAAVTAAAPPATMSAAAPAHAPAPAPSASAASGTGYFWNEQTVIEGTLVSKQIQYSNGPVPVVVFDHAITIKPKAGDDTPALPGAKEAWLSYNGIDKAAVTKLIGKKVTYKGMLNPSQTAHHLSNPWLDGSVTAR